MQAQNRIKLIVIVGPTASGKSELAVKLAKKLGGEIISADSRQIYKGLNIGTGKVPGRWVKNVSSKERPLVNWNFLYKDVPHYCIDFVDPKKTYTAAEFKKCAEGAIADITAHGKMPIIAGGTGFWIDAAVYDLNIPKAPPNPKLRKTLEKKDLKELLKILKKLDPRRAKNIEQKNPRRLIRAIEVAKALGKVPPVKKHFPYQVSWIGLKPNDLKKRITARVKTMLKKGLARETEKLLEKGVSKNRVREFGFEYRLSLDFLEKKLGRQQFLENLVRESLQYARRQMTWFKRNKKILWNLN